MERLATILVCLVCLVPLCPATLAGDSLGQALSGGKPHVDLRYRYETVDQDGFDDDADASTLRLRLGYTTGVWHGFFASGDFEHVERLGPEDYDDTANGMTQFPIVADPEATELNQIFVGHSGLEGAEFRLGRQRFTVGNHRFIGNVGWRQNEQTYDAFTARWAHERISLVLGYLDNANTVFGDDHPARSEVNLSAGVASLSFRIAGGTLTGYVHLMEFEDDTDANRTFGLDPTSSHRNVGARFQGEHALSEEVDLLYAAELARQSDYRDGSSAIDATYLQGEIGVRVGSLTPKLTYELLGSNDGRYGFATPLATLHGFNGWADQFLTTPANGLEDLAFSLAAEVGRFELLAVWHDFSADEGGEDFGSELDLQVRRTFKKRYTVLLKHADFDTDSGTKPDTRKTWLMLALKI